MDLSDDQVLSRKAAAIEPSVTLVVSALAAALKAEGKSVIAFAAGEPDLETPDVVREAGIEAIRQDRGRYTAASGMPALREAIARRFASLGFGYGPDQVMCSAGAKSSLYLAFFTLLNEGDEVVFPAPYWTSYPDMVRAAGGRPVPFPTDPDTDFQPRPDRLEEVLTDRTRILLLNSPNNPTGTVYSQETLLALADVVRRRRDLVVVTDDIYERLIYTDEPFRNILHAAPELEDRTVCINGLSKSHSMTGWRMGFAAGPRQIVSAMGRVQSQIAGNPPTISQFAALAALEHPPADSRRESLDVRRRLLMSKLQDLEGVTCPVPRGAFYAFPSISPYLGRRHNGEPLRTSTDLARALLEDQLVATVAGDAFGAPGHIRLTYTVPPADIEEGVRRLGIFLKSLT